MNGPKLKRTDTHPGGAAPIGNETARTSEQTGTCPSHIQMNNTNKKDVKQFTEDQGYDFCL